LTWGETANDNVKFNTQRDKRVAFRLPRPMTCSATAKNNYTFFAKIYARRL
jgi:hypothetical protein